MKWWGATEAFSMKRPARERPFLRLAYMDDQVYVLGQLARPRWVLFRMRFRSLSLCALVFAGLPATTQAQTFTPIRVNVGGAAYTDTLGHVWSADYGSNGAGGLADTTNTIAGTPDQPLYRTWRYGYKSGIPLAFTYNVPNGNYGVTLKFDETLFNQAGQRVFNVTINGQTVLSSFDIFAVGGVNTAVDQQFPVTVSTGQIVIIFLPVVTNPKICAIQILAAAPTLTSISPNNGTPGTTVPVTLTGSNLSGATVKVSGTGISVSGVTSTATQINATFTIGTAAAGSYNVTATTPGGTSNAVTFAVNAPPPPSAPSLTSITPSSGTAGSAVDVTLAGANLSGATLNISGTGISVGNLNAAPSQITATLTIAANAATGPYSISATTAGGTSTPVSFTVNAPPPPPSNGPNIVLILADDMRYDEMPHLPLTGSLIGPESVKFLNYFVSTPLCCPSRASMLTGLHAHNTGVYQNYGPSNAGAPAFKDSSTIATWLKGAGYLTGLYGKYLNGYYNLPSGYIPPGWSDWHAFVSSPGATGNPSDGNFYYGYTINDNGVLTVRGSAPSDYGTDVIFQDAINYIQNAPSGKPLFLYVAPYAPHDPFIAAPQDIGKYSCCPPLRAPSFNEADVSEKPFWLQALPLMTAADIATNDSRYHMTLDTLASLDRDIQNLINALVAAGRWGNTVLLFASDNGLFWGEHRLSNGKDSVYEEAVKVPLWIRVPGQATRTETSLVENIDLAPTIAAWAGATPASKVNGVNLIPLLNQTATGWRTEILLEELGTSSTQTTFSAVRNAQFVYVEYADGEREFYDLLADPYQMTNQINNAAYSATISALQAKLATLKIQ